MERLCKRPDKSLLLALHAVLVPLQIAMVHNGGPKSPRAAIEPDSVPQGVLALVNRWMQTRPRLVGNPFDAHGGLCARHEFANEAVSGLDGLVQLIQALQLGAERLSKYRLKRSACWTARLLAARIREQDFAWGTGFLAHGSVMKLRYEGAL